jgi:hypothetical protein
MFDHDLQRLQILLDRLPDQIVLHVIVLMAVDAAGSSHIG